MFGRCGRQVRYAHFAFAVIVALGGCSDLKPEDRIKSPLNEAGSEDTRGGETEAADASMETLGSADVSTETQSDADVSVTTPDGAVSDGPDVQWEERSPDGQAADGAADTFDDGDGNGSDASCIPDCPELGQFRCGGDADAGVLRQLQVCSLVRGCLQWLDTATCRADEACCEGSCKSLDSASACHAPPDFDYYVDAKRGSDDLDGGSTTAGTRQRPFRTVSRAVRAATNLARPGRRIYVAAGKYDSAHGEAFPLVLRGGVSIHGAGPTLVTIHGSGELNHQAAGGVYNGSYKVTVVVGDDSATTTVAGATILGEAPSPLPDYFGIFCDRGSRPEAGDAVGATVLENVVIGPGYHHGIMAVSSDASDASVASGCKLQMFDSTATGAWYGIVATGCREGQDGFPVSIRVGDVNRGNSFTWTGTPFNQGAGILLRNCVTQSSVRHTHFVDSAGGIHIEQQGDVGIGIHPFVFEHNVFSKLSADGVSVVGNAAAVVLNDNVFSNISTAPSGDYRAVAVVIVGSGGHLPLKKARRNTFIGNDLAINVFSPSDSVDFGASGGFDLGTPADLGENKFLCNAMVGNPLLDVGGDIWLNLPGPGLVPLSGNLWDHFPPRAALAESTANGTDVTFQVVPPPTLDSSGGRVDTTPCPPDRIRGPAGGDGGMR